MTMPMVMKEKKKKNKRMIEYWRLLLASSFFRHSRSSHELGRSVDSVANLQLGNLGLHVGDERAQAGQRGAQVRLHGRHACLQLHQVLAALRSPCVVRTEICPLQCADAEKGKQQERKREK